MASNKLLVKFAHLIDIDEDMIEKRNLIKVKLLIRCENLDSIIKE